MRAVVQYGFVFATVVYAGMGVGTYFKACEELQDGYVRDAVIFTFLSTISLTYVCLFLVILTGF